MPEGDTIKRAANALHRALAGQVVTRFQTGLAQLAKVDRDAPIAGRTVERVESVGKHLLFRFSGGLTLRTHQRMNGTWHLYRPGERWRKPRASMRVVLETADFVAVGFDLPVADFFTDAQLARDPELRALGPDLLAPDFDPAEALRRFRARGTVPASFALLDQRVMAGVGNQYKSELLFLEGVHPRAPVSSLPDETLLGLIERARELLRQNTEIAASLYRGPRRTTRRADPGAHFWVYGRAGEPCRKCGTPIAFAKEGLAARVTYWCPRCQPEVAGGPGR